MEEWRQAQNQPVRRTYKQKWKSNDELEAQRRRPGKREREALRQQGPAVPSPRETPKWPPPPPPSPRRAVKREQITQSENPPGEVSATSPDPVKVKILQVRWQTVVPDQVKVKSSGRGARASQGGETTGRGRATAGSGEGTKSPRGQILSLG